MENPGSTTTHHNHRGGRGGGSFGRGGGRKWKNDGFGPPSSSMNFSPSETDDLDGSTTTSSSTRPKAQISPEIQSTFLAFQKQLDAKNDKWERLVKISRDVTIESKRIIFLLHRVTRDKQPDSVMDEAQQRIKALKADKFYLIAQDLREEDPYQFLNAFRPGLQEFVEAESFLHYLKNQSLLAYHDFCRSLEFEADPKTDADKESKDEGGGLTRTMKMKVLVTIEDFLCGMGDLSGELMRLAINYISSAMFDQPLRIVDFLRHLYEGFCLIGRIVASRDFNTKLRVMKQNLTKVENACYVLKLRGTEIPQHMLVDAVTSSFFNNSYNQDEMMHASDFTDA